MADRPILFSAPMVRALLAGTKTQTRRLLSEARVFATPETKAFTLRGDDLARALQNASRFRRLDGNGWFWEADAFEWQAPALRTGWMAHIGYAPGDRLWVREAWRTQSFDDHWRPSELNAGNTLWRYEADGVRSHPDPVSRFGKLRPSMYMPRWASRLTLIVTDVRVQRLQDISEEDARAEGVVCLGRMDGEPWDHCYVPGVTRGYEAEATSCYSLLWEQINGSGAWAANPWVMATSFEVHHRNILEMEAAANG